MTKEKEFTIEIMKQEDEREVYDLLARSFFKDEPLSCDDEPPKFEDVHALKAIYQGYSVKAVDAQGNIIGVSINIDFSKFKKFTDFPKTERLEKIFALMDYIDQHVNRPPGLLDGHIITVDAAWRNKGIAKELCEKTEKLAKEAGFSGMNSLCTAVYTRMIGEARGFKCIYSMKYKDYVDQNGRPIFNTKPPHNEVSVCIKLFDNKY
uniref:aralkylamine N-acetyltransferase n=1 Tax=Rhodnius neglectus TaxID=72488 RepID=A0A0N7Z8J1_9HEMI